MIQYIIFCSDILIPKNCLEIAGELPVSGPENYPVNVPVSGPGKRGSRIPQKFWCHADHGCKIRVNLLYSVHLVRVVLTDRC